jgi:hypothetical protein
MSSRWNPKEFFRVLRQALRGRLVARDSWGRWIIKSPSGKRAMLDDKVIQAMLLKGAAKRLVEKQNSETSDEADRKKKS